MRKTSEKLLKNRGMKVVSLSIDDETADKIILLSKKLSIKSRSRIMRLAVNSLERENHSIDEMKGICSYVITITYGKHESSPLNYLVEKYEDIIQTELHQHSGGICSRVLIAKGPAEKMRELMIILKRRKGIASLSFNKI